MELYTDKNAIYFTNVRHDLIKLIPENSENKVLEIGSGGGDTLVEIKQKGLAKEVVGIELFSMPDTHQDHSSIDQFIICDIEKIDPELKDNYFDVILCGDVMEHLLDPWSVVEKITKFLKPGGVIIASIPNIRFRKAVYKIFVKGDFGYTKDGTFDKTHFRFFCRKNIVQLFSTPELSVQNTYPNFKIAEGATKARLLNTLTLGIFEEFIALQFLVIAKKRGT
ncbi:MAG: class I SAM-dependent methyltransferase [Cyclobacteriaceae bacterium]